MTISNYRFDVRSKEQFKLDIKTAHEAEFNIAKRLCQFKYSINKIWPKLESNGIDMSGKYVDKATLDPDFLIDGNLIEITRSNNICKKTFHQKLSKVDNCIKNKAILIFVNGYIIDEEPLFITINSKHLEKLSLKSKEKYGIVPLIGGGKVGIINKDALRFDLDWFLEKEKFKLPKLTKLADQKYSNTLYEKK